MDPARKRRIRLVVALTAALLLSTALVYTSVSASSEAKSPGELLASANQGQTYQVVGKVVNGSIRHHGVTTTFRLRDRDGTAAIPVSYSAAVPDTFRDGREIIIRLRASGTGFIGEKDSLVTKCPSKFTASKS